MRKDQQLSQAVKFFANLQGTASEYGGHEPKLKSEKEEPRRHKKGKEPAPNFQNLDPSVVFCADLNKDPVTVPIQVGNVIPVASVLQINLRAWDCELYMIIIELPDSGLLQGCNNQRYRFVVRR